VNRVFRIAALAGVLISLWPLPAAAQVELFKSDRLIDATISNDYELAKSELIKGHIPDPVDSYRRTPLIIAAMAGNPDLVELLVKYKANLNTRDEAGAGAFHYAAARGHTDVVEMLVELGAKINIENRQGMTPLMVAAADGKIEIVQILLNSKADATRNDFTGRSALMWAERNGRRNVIRLLRQAGIKE
jgi:uncharacterized protein